MCIRDRHNNQFTPPNTTTRWSTSVNWRLSTDYVLCHPAFHFIPMPSLYTDCNDNYFLKKAIYRMWKLKFQSLNVRLAWQTITACRVSFQLCSNAMLAFLSSVCNNPHVSFAGNFSGFSTQQRAAQLYSCRTIGAACYGALKHAPSISMKLSSC